MTLPTEPLAPKQCAFCGDTFVPVTGKQIYDVADCRYRAARQRAYEKRQAEKAALAEKRSLHEANLAALQAN